MRTRGLWPLLQAVSRVWICSGMFAVPMWFWKEPTQPRDGALRSGSGG